MLKYIAWRNLLSISILCGHRRGVAGTAPRKARLARLSATSRGAGNEPLNNLNENKIILSSNCW
jgi:hypothetical protein